MYRTSIQKYKNYSAAGQVIKELCPTLADLLNKIENYVSEHEVIEVHHRQRKHSGKNSLV